MLQRRKLLQGLAAAPVAGLPLATILASPDLARAAALALDAVEITNTNGNKVTGALAVPAQTPAAAVVVIHEWWGLNDRIKAFTGELARQGYLALAVDLMNGGVATTSAEARRLTVMVPPEERNATLGAWIDWLKDHPQATGKLGTVGFCFGGGWSLAASLVRPVDATVVYYGRVNRPAEALTALAGPVLGHFATRDRFINKSMVDGFTKEMAAAGKPLEAHWYEADHGFANPTSARYDAADTKAAMARTLAFFAKHLS